MHLSAFTLHGERVSLHNLTETFYGLRAVYLDKERAFCTLCNHYFFQGYLLHKSRVAALSIVKDFQKARKATVLHFSPFLNVKLSISAILCPKSHTKNRVRCNHFSEKVDTCHAGPQPCKHLPAIPSAVS